MPTFTQQINQENQDLAEIQKVARMTPQKMFWQWVSVASWFLGGVLVAMVLNIIFGRFVFNNPDSKWFNSPLNPQAQDFLKNYIFILPSLVVLGVIFGVLFIIWVRSFWNQISANFLQITRTEKLIFAGYGFWLGLEMLGFKVDLESFSYQIWSYTFYWFKGLDNITWSLVALIFHYLVFAVLAIRWSKVLIDFSKGRLLKYDKNYEELPTKSWWVWLKKSTLITTAIITQIIFWFSYNNLLEQILLIKITPFLISYLATICFCITNLLLFNKKFYLNLKNYNRIALFTSTSLSAQYISLVGSLDLPIFINIILSIFIAFTIFTEISHIPKGVLTFSEVFRYFIRFDIRIKSFLAPDFFLKYLGLLAIGLIVFNSRILIVSVFIAYYSILAQFFITSIIQGLFKQAKQNSVIKPEEPLDDFEHVQQILGENSSFLAGVKDFEDKKIICYPLQNLQNRSYVYALDAIWGAGKTTFIKLVENLVTKKNDKEEEDKNEKWWQKIKLLSWLESIDLINRQGKNEVIWIDFNPWNYITSEKLITDFFDTLEHRISKIYGNGFDKIIGKYVNLLGSTKPSFWGVDLNFEFNPLKQDQDLAVLKHKISERLSNIKEKIVIVIDDIDRLPPEMVLTVLRLVGISANFPNIIFILAMDYDKVEQIVQKELGEQYQNYLQKIVNERVKVPKWGYEDLEKLFNYYTKEAVERFQKLEGLENIVREDLLKFKVDDEEVGIFENYIVRSFCKAFITSIDKASERGDLKINHNKGSEYIDFEYKNISSELYDATGKHIVPTDVKASITSIFYSKNSLKSFVGENDKLKGLAILYNLITKDIISDLNFKEEALTSINQTPRDIKQLANNYIYEVAKIYDQQIKDLTFENYCKVPEKPFSEIFLDKIKEELPEIVKATVAKQRFNLN